MRVLGKAIGGGLGYYLGGPFGALLGAALGHQLMDSTPREYQGLAMSELEIRNSVFFVAIFSMFGKLAMADEKLSEEETAAVEHLIRTQFRLSFKSEEFAVKTFHQAIEAETSFTEYAEQFHDYFRDDKAILTAMIEMMLTVAHADGNYHPKEEALIRSAADLFGLSESYSQILGMFAGSDDSIETCYQILGCTPDDDLATIKKRYRQLTMDFHPDRIQAKGLPHEFLDFATEKFKEIQKAYDQVLKARG